MNSPNLRSLRKARDLTLVEVAQAVGADNGNLSRIERGIQLPDIRLGKRLAAYFNVTLDEIYAHVDTKPQAGQAATDVSLAPTAPAPEPIHECASGDPRYHPDRRYPEKRQRFERRKDAT